MNPNGDRTRTVAAVVVLAAIVALGTWLRVQALPGAWGSDALHYGERAAAGAGWLPDSRSQRFLFLSMVRAGMSLGGNTPESASIPGVVVSACVGPVLWLALRRSAGAFLALVPAAIWAVLGLDVEEVVEISADAAVALPGALVALSLVFARDREEHRLRWLAVGGLSAGLGLITKETSVFPATALVLGALLLGRGRRRWVLAGTAAGAVAAVLCAAAAAGILQRPGVISHETAAAFEPVHWDEPGFAARLTIGVPQMLLTATGAFGWLHVLALPLVVRLFFRAARGDALAAAALTGIAVYVVMPVSWNRYGVLTTGFPRYVLPVLPLWFAALTEALAERPSGRWETGASLGAVCVAASFSGPGTTALLLVLGGLFLVFVGAGIPGARLCAAAALVAATAASLTRPGARTVPDRTWLAWQAIPAAGTVHAERLVARRVRLAALSHPGADAARVRILEPDAPPPGDLRPGDVVLARRATPLARACAARADLVPLDADLGETLAWTVR